MTDHRIGLRQGSGALGRTRRAFSWAALVPLVLLPLACRDPATPAACAVLPSVSGWTELGPAGTWITAVAISPSGLLVGTKAQGVLRYDSCENRWVRIGLEGRFITSIKSLPPPSNRLLVTVIPLAPDTVSAVVYASDDGGTTWYARDGGLSAQRGGYGYAFSLAVDALDVDRLYMGLPAAVVRSVDGGATWSSTYGDPLALGMEVSSLATSPRGSGRVWAGGEDLTLRAFVLRSDDRGDTWTKYRPSPFLEDVVFSMAVDSLADDRLFAGMGGGVRVTEDGGATWRSALSLRAPGLVTGLSLSGSRLVAVSDEQAPSSTPSGTVLGVYLTRDLGTSWNTLAVPASASGGIALAMSAGGAAFIGTRSGLWSVRLE